MNIFYTKDGISTLLRLPKRCSIIRVLGIPYAVTTQSETIQLLAFDSHRSPLQIESFGTSAIVTYSPYGYSALQSLPVGYKGEFFEPVTQGYPLGAGYRIFNPVLRRLNSPDSLSPFSGGGMNAYIYVFGDPINKDDPSGHMPVRSLPINFNQKLRQGRLRATMMFDRRSRKTIDITLDRTVVIQDEFKFMKGVSRLVGEARKDQDFVSITLSVGSRDNKNPTIRPWLAQAIADENARPVNFYLPAPRGTIGDYTFEGTSGTYNLHTVEPNTYATSTTNAFSVQQQSSDTRDT